MRKVKTTYGSSHIYKYYCKITGNPLKLSNAAFSAILKKFLTAKLEAMIYRGIEFNMPPRLGGIRIRKSKIRIALNAEGKLDKRNLPPDWKATKKLWEEKYPGLTPEQLKQVKNKPIIYHLNRHSDGYLHKWHWDKNTCTVKNSSGYTLEIIRAADRKLAAALKNEDLQLDYSLY